MKCSRRFGWSSSLYTPPSTASDCPRSVSAPAPHWRDHLSSAAEPRSGLMSRQLTSSEPDPAPIRHREHRTCGFMAFMAMGEYSTNSVLPRIFRLDMSNNCKLFTKPQRSGGVVITAVYCGFALQLLTQVTGEECVRRSREIGRYGGGLRKKRSRPPLPPFCWHLVTRSSIYVEDLRWDKSCICEFSINN